MIKQIWFDFGNIFIPVHPQLTREALEKCGVQMSEESFEALAQEFEKGEISSKAFFQALTMSCKFLQSSRCVKMGWDALLGELQDQTLFLKKLAQEYSICLVSNTNEAHIQTIKEQSGPFLWNTFTEKFDALFLSYEMGCRKPDPEYYDRVLEAMGALPEEVLFIDDTQANLDTAAEMGMHTWLFNIQEGDLEKELPAVLAKFNERTARTTGV
jgi:putative hydrolase of the HAD superfamily